MPVALLIMIFRKMVKNRWLQLSLLLGLTLAVALISSMPVYSDAILHRMLLKDLENIQLNKNIYPGMITSRLAVSKDVSQINSEKLFKQSEAYLLDHTKQFTLPMLSYVRTKTTYFYPLIPVDPSKIDKTQNRGASIVAMNDLEKHIRLIDGQLPAKELVNGAYEVIVKDVALAKLKMVLGNEFTMKNDDKIKKDSIRVRIVGVFEPKAENDLYWEGVTDSGSTAIFMNDSLYDKQIIGALNWPVYMVNWNAALDYTQIKLSSLTALQASYSALDAYFRQFMDYKFESPMIETLKSYEQKMQKLRILLWSLYAPMLVLLSFYLFMVEHLMIQRQKNDISIFRSRGASRWQIIWGYLIESLLLGALALAMGPPLGVLMTKLLGASNGFLEFVQRAALDAHLSSQSYKYALLTIVGSIAMTLIPAFLATRSTIVGHKQSLARGQKQSFAHKYYIDIVLIAVSFYGYYSFKQRTLSLRTLGLDSLDFSIDPLLFVIPALFIIGMGLFLLRIYPWVIQLIFWLGKKWWSPSAYTSLVQVSRSSVNYQFVMVFLVITIATGLFSASAARTINRNIEEQTQYKVGADMVLTTQWQNDAPPPSFGPPGMSASAAAEPLTRKKIQYKEPSFLVFSQLNGVEHAARVFKKERTSVSYGNGTSEAATFMGIDTDDFGKTAWLRDGLLGHHFYEYLNLIAGDPSSVLISRTVADKLKVKVGDIISVNWQDTPYGTFNVFAIIDYWPSWMPNPDATADKDNKIIKSSMPMLVVGNLSYIQATMAIEPYQVWLKLLPGATSKQVYDSMEEKKLSVTSLSDEKQAFIESKKDPFRLAINGVMTLGFVVSIMICFFGFLLYWILTLSGRVLQFGIFRAMGMSLQQVIRMLFIEQLLTSGAAIVTGAITGLVTSQIFVSFFQISFNPATQALPFHVITDSKDQLNLFYVVFFMIALALVILGFMLSRIRIHQAVKLGED